MPEEPRSTSLLRLSSLHRRDTIPVLDPRTRDDMVHMAKSASNRAILSAIAEPSITSSSDCDQSMTPDPKLPHTFPRRVLLCVVGLTPQVVTETLWVLAVQSEPPFVPTELVIVTTREGAERIELMLLKGKRMLDALAADYPGRGLEGLAQRTAVHVVCDPSGSPLSDIATLEANTALADLLFDVVRNLTADPASAVHLSIAGGRKTMGFLAGYALSLVGRTQDRLSHVLVDPAFEQHPEFFYPPPEPKVLLSQSKDQRPISTDRAGIVLAEIPFVRLREGVPDRLLKGQASFADTVAALQEQFHPPELIIDLAQQKVQAHGRHVPCAPIELAFWAWLAERRKTLGDAAAVDKTNPAAFTRFFELYEQIAGYEPRKRTEQAVRADPKNNWLSERITRHNKLVAHTLGPAARHYGIEASGKRPRTRWQLATPPEAIRLVGLP